MEEREKERGWRRERRREGGEREVRSGGTWSRCSPNKVFYLTKANTLKRVSSRVSSRVGTCLLAATLVFKT